MNVNFRPEVTTPITGPVGRPRPQAPATLPTETLATPGDQVVLGPAPTPVAPVPAPPAAVSPPAVAPTPPSAPPAPAPGTLIQLDDGLSGISQGTNLTSLTQLDPAAQPESVTNPIMEVLGRHPGLAKVVQKLVDDTAHPMNLVSYIKDSQRGPAVLQELAQMASLPSPQPEQLPAVVKEHHAPEAALLNSDDASFSETDGRKNSALLKERLLGQDAELYSIRGGNATGQVRLEEHATRLRREVMPALHKNLEACLAGIESKDGFPAVNTRAKSAAGILDKIERMQAGNDGKAPRPDYSLADMPDAVGGRITVRNVDQLETAMKALEERFGADNIVEKDNFYSNPVKRERPYRVITYTVLQDGVPCEVQITSLRSSLAADLWHNTGYKKLHPDLSEGEIDQIAAIQRAVTADEHRQIGQTGVAT